MSLDLPLYNLLIGGYMLYVKPPYVEVFGAQAVVRYQGETQLY